MILDTGIAVFYHPAEHIPGSALNRDGLKFHTGWYGERTVGVSRYYAAKQNNDRIDVLVRILREGAWREIGTDDYAVLTDGCRYRVRQVQHVRDTEAGEDALDISLERIGMKDVGENHT